MWIINLTINFLSTRLYFTLSARISTCLTSNYEYYVKTWRVEERNWILLLRRSGWSLVVGIHTEAAVAPHYWALEQRKGRGGEWETTLVFKGSQQARSEGRAGRWCTPLSPFDGFFMFNLWWHPAGHQDHSSPAHPSSSLHWHVRSWISGQTIAFWASIGGARPPTPILSSISWRAFSNCWGVPRMEKMRTLGSVLGGGFLCSSTWARDCSLMFLMVSPPGRGSNKNKHLTGAATNNQLCYWLTCPIIFWIIVWSKKKKKKKSQNTEIILEPPQMSRFW